MSKKPARQSWMFHSLPSSRFQPRRYCPGRIGNWSGHLPFAADLIDALKPALVVELGTHYGESYFGFCQAIRGQSLNCHAFAVDSWVGDSQTGRYGPEVYREVSAYNAEHYQSFSTLLRMSFDEALESFADATIDLLHFDGCHTYEAIRHDFGAWLPKVRAGGIILIHDIAVRTGDFGTWQFWEEVAPHYPSFAFYHSCGLGVLRKDGSAAMNRPFLAEILTAAVDPEGIRDYYVLCAERLQYAHQAAGEYTSFCQIFSPDETGYSEDRSSMYPVSAGATTALEFSLPSPSGHLRLDPCDCPGVIEISDIIVDSPLSGAILWRLDPAQLHEVQCAGTSIRIPDGNRLILCSYGGDPQLHLPLRESLNPEESVRVRCTLRIDRHWQAIGSLWRDMEAGLTRAYQEAAANEQRAVRLEAELAEAASHTRHAKNLLDESREKRADAEIRLAQAASQAAHYKNLLDELHQKQSDSESQTAHYKNLLDELHQKQSDSQSQTAHYKNLLDELQQKQTDSETRLAQAASQAEHHKKLLNELQQKQTNSDTRLAQAASQAAHHKSLLDELRQKQNDAETRLVQAASQSAQDKSLLEELRQKQNDAQTRLAQAESQVVHYKNLMNELKQMQADSEIRLAQAVSQIASRTALYNNLREEQTQRRIDLESLRTNYQAALSEVIALRKSLSWRITAPLRYFRSILRFSGPEKPPTR